MKDYINTLFVTLKLSGYDAFLDPYFYSMDIDHYDFLILEPRVRFSILKREEGTYAIYMDNPAINMESNTLEEVTSFLFENIRELKK